MKQYLDLLRNIKENGRFKSDRTGTGTLSIFGTQMRFDLTKGFPLVTSKKVHVKSIIHELLWILSGDTSVKYLQDNGVKIWDEWCNDQGELGPVYGSQLRKWQGKVLAIPDSATTFETRPDGENWLSVVNSDSAEYEVIDQMQLLMDNLQKDPFSRRHLVTMWNPSVLPDTAFLPKENASMGKQALPACHAFFQFYCDEATIWERAAFGGDAHFNGKYRDLRGKNEALIHDKFDEENIPRLRLSCQLYQRSVDIFLGNPFNIASYALLTHMVAQQLNYMVGDFVWTGGDTHLYSNHFEQADLQLTREPFPLPTLKILRKPDSIFQYKFEDFLIENYQHHEAIKAPVAV